MFQRTKLYLSFSKLISASALFLKYSCSSVLAWGRGGGGDVVIVPVPANFNYKVKMRLKLTGDSDPIMDIQIRIQTKSVLTIIDRDNFCIPLFIRYICRLIIVQVPTALTLSTLRNLVQCKLLISAGKISEINYIN